MLRKLRLSQKNCFLKKTNVYLSNFWRTLEMLLINYEGNIILTQSVCCAISERKAEKNLAITDTKHYALVVTLSTQDNANLLQELKLGFKITSNWKKQQSKISTEAQNQYFDYLIDPSFHGVFRIFVLLFENNTHESRQTKYFLLKVDCNIIINGKNFFHQPIKNDLTTYDNIRKITADQTDDYTTGCPLNHPYLKANYNLITIDLCKQQAFDADPEAMQQIKFTGDLNQQGFLDFSQGTVRRL